MHGDSFLRQTSHLDGWHSPVIGRSRLTVRKYEFFCVRVVLESVLPLASRQVSLPANYGDLHPSTKRALPLHQGNPVTGTSGNDPAAILVVQRCRPDGRGFASQ